MRLRNRLEIIVCVILASATHVACDATYILHGANDDASTDAGAPSRHDAAQSDAMAHDAAAMVDATPRDGSFDDATVATDATAAADATATTDAVAFDATHTNDADIDAGEVRDADPPDANVSTARFDVAYVSEFTVHDASAFGVRFTTLFIATDAIPLDLAQLEIAGVTVPYRDVSFRVTVDPSTRVLASGQAAGNLASAFGETERLIVGSGLVGESWVERTLPTLNISFALVGENFVGDFEVSALVRIGARTATLPFTFHFSASPGDTSYDGAKRVSSN